MWFTLGFQHLWMITCKRLGVWAAMGFPVTQYCYIIKTVLKGHTHITAKAKSFSTTDQCLRQCLMDYFQDSYDVRANPVSLLFKL